MGNIYEKIKKSSPLKDGHDWVKTDDEIQDSAGNKLINAEKRTVGGSDAEMGYGGKSMKLTPEQQAWKDRRVKELGGLQQYRDFYKIGKKDVVLKEAVEGTDEYRGDQSDKPGEPGKPQVKQYNAGFYEAYSAKLAAKQEDKIAKQKQKRDDKAIRKYEEGSRGFLGIGKGKGKGDLNERVVSGYESRGKKNENFTYDADGNITGEASGDQVVSKQMRDRANTLSMNKTGQELGSTLITQDATADKEGEKGLKKIAGTLLKNSPNKSKTPFKMSAKLVADKGDGKITAKDLMRERMFDMAGHLGQVAKHNYEQDKGESPLSKLKKNKRGCGY
jgi:hypothetical protein